jgi:hypothetical protein
MARRNRRQSVLTSPIALHRVEDVPDDELGLYVHSSIPFTAEDDDSGKPWEDDEGKSDDPDPDEGRGSDEHTEDTDSEGDDTVPSDEAEEEDDKPFDKESLRVREAQILRAMAKATLDEQRTLMGELNEVRRVAAALVSGEREVDLANAVVHAHLTPVVAHSFGLSKETDWLDEIQVTASGASVEQAMTVEATLWYQGRDAAVLADRDEFRIQAEGTAHLLASQYGSDAHRAARAFLDHVSHLHRVAADPDGSGVAESGLPQVEPSNAPEVLDNFQPDVAPENEAAHAEAEGDGSEDEMQAQGSRRVAAKPGPRTAESGAYATDSHNSGIRYECPPGSIAVVEASYANFFGGASYDWGVTGPDGVAICSGVQLGGPWSTGVEATRRTAADEGGSTCSVCGDAIAKDPDGSYHHDNGEKHDHEAKAGGGDSKEARRLVAWVAQNLSPAKRAQLDAMPRPHMASVVRKIVADVMADPSGASVSGLPQVEVMKALDELAEWEIEDVDSDDTKAKGQADVAGSPNPFTSAANPKLDAFKARIAANRGTVVPPFVREAEASYVNSYGLNEDQITAGQQVYIEGVTPARVVQIGVDAISNMTTYELPLDVMRRPGGDSGAMPVLVQTEDGTLTDVVFDSLSATRQATAARRTAMPNPVDLGVGVGDIFVSSWGYDQTNIDFFEVVRLTGASVVVRPIGKDRIEMNGPGGNKVMPRKGAFTGQEMTKRISGVGPNGDDRGFNRPAFSVNSYATAFLWDGQPEYETDSQFGH